ncbi:hypothetical protein [Candidatus Thiothrix anitrata]|uniref:Uncharacterized protein n=1 Tax=Candidatus Thiothrix anitrata TaxID=2823902 RepID=A0ABX7X3U3_9GAMM|nr:hypothetical protein [Candidatus Thiothrix anitrata]QTR50524.1 hypothetical protein J8380_02845 [Candidatus Thiothrix anitrata]
MQHMKLKLAAAITAALLAGSVQAETWEITQTTTPGAATTMSQDGATAAGSVQGMNVIKSTTATVNQAATGTAQTAAVTGLTTLNQTGTTENSTQALNYISVDTIGATGAFAQSETGTLGATLNQTATGTGGNTQAVNTATATTEITTLTQSNGGGPVELNQTAAAVDGIQAVNNAESAVLGTIDQDVTSTTLGLVQTGGSGKTQAGNRAVSEGAVTEITQTVTPSGAVTLGQNGTALSTQAGNLLDLTGSDGALADGTQEFTATAGVTMTQGTTSAVETSVQAGNATLTGANNADGNVLVQSLSAATLAMTQTDATTSIQAANYLGGLPQ